MGSHINLSSREGPDRERGAGAVDAQSILEVRRYCLESLVSLNRETSYGGNREN